MMKARYASVAALLATLFTLAMGCELLSQVDRSKVDQNNTGGQAGQGGGGAGGGGTGGAQCPVDDNNECTDDVCNTDGTTAHNPKSAGSPCSSGGSQCDDSGKCVECLAASDCPGEDGACQVRACTAGACGFDFTAEGTAVPVQVAGDCKLTVCDGQGAIKDQNDDTDVPDDANACTSDVCDAGTPSNPFVPEGTSCGKNGAGDPLVCDAGGQCVGCNVASDCPGADDECKTRTCQGSVCGFDFTPVNTPLATQTPGDCLKQVCDGNGNIVASNDNNDVPPDDGDTCTNDTCAGGVPVHPNKQNGSLCDDGNACTQLDTCQSGACAGSLPVTCKALDQCHAVGVCDQATGMCSSPEKADGSACNDGDLCTTGDTCLAGVCAAGPPTTCAAPDQCHSAGTCNPVSGQCTYAPKANGTTCDDNNPCTQTDTCQGGTCAGGNPVTCTAPNQCQLAGSCDSSTGQCVYPSKANGSSCNDSNACTQNEACQNGACTPATTTTCAALDQCHAAGTCNPATGVCSNPNKANGSACSDNNACTQSDTCQNGACTGASPVTCTAQDQCHTAGTCNPATGACSNPNKANGAACNDGNACTQSDSCQSGACTGANPKTCTAQDQCHTAGMCDPQSGACSNPSKADGTSCSDNNACTQSDSCVSGVCTSGTPVTCSAQDECHVAGTCNPQSGACSNPNAPEGQVCSIGACANGVCGGCGNGTVGPGELCDDGNFVNGDGCDNNCTPTGCGNAVVTMGELCDDGNLVNGDGCDNNCKLTGCGNGIVTMGELCDDGNLTNGDGCDDGMMGNCTPTMCGNGVVTMGEACDDGNAANGDGCDNNCKLTGCGNGVVTMGEACDDGNVLSSDGCSAKCQVEAPYSCAGNPSVCTSAKEIDCNDGKDNDGDGAIDCADSDCALGCNASVGPCAAGETMLVYTATDTPQAIPDSNATGIKSNIVVGGLGLVKRVVVQTNITHTWDADVDAYLKSPGNVTTDITTDNGSSGDNYTDTILNDACATNVTAGVAPFAGCYKPETALSTYTNAQAKGTWIWNVSDDTGGDVGTLNAFRLSFCVAQSNCGDGAIDPGEGCDDANSVTGDGCSPLCALEAGFTCAGAPSVCMTTCGDGVVAGAEQCDDGNAVNGDGCDINCKTSACGNGIVAPNEQCDDSNTVNGDGCDSNCKLTACGNGVLTTGEACDDGNLTAADGCDATCQVEANYACVGFQPNVCAPICGNSVITAPEVCDDGNTAAGDACDSACATQANLTEIEPNDTIAGADTAAMSGILISGPSTVISGAITPTLDKDIYKVVIATPGVVRAEVFDGSGYDCTAANVPAAMKLSLLSSAGTLIVADTVTSGIGLCPELMLNAIPGTYYVQVEKSAAGTIAAYKLEVKFQTDKGSESEPNDSRLTSDGFPGSDVFIFGGHQISTDADWYAINVPAGKSVRAEIIEGSAAETCESFGIDSQIYLVSPAGTDLGNDDDDGRGFCSEIDGTGATPLDAFAHNLAGGQYYIRVQAHGVAVQASYQFDYRMAVTIR